MVPGQSPSPYSSPGAVALFGDGAAVLGTFSGLLLLVLVATGLARRSRGLVALTGVSAAAVLALTLVPNGGWAAFALAPDALESIRANLRPQPGDLSAWAHAADGPPNVALFVPLGLTLALLLRRPALATAAATGLSVAIECYQASLTTRVGSFADVVSNGLGALVGAALATVLLAVLSARRPGQSRTVARSAASPV